MIARATLVVAALVAIATDASAQLRPVQLSRHIEFWNPDWSPDGKSIVFESTLDGRYSIYTIDVDGSHLKRLTADSMNSEQPRWSPDGKRIAFSSDRAGGHLEIWVMNADGSAQTRLTTTPSGAYYQSSFSPDGKWIAFQGRPDSREVRERVYVIAADGSTSIRQITDSAYSAEDPEWSSDGRFVTYAQVPYPKRYWSELQPDDMAAAKAATVTALVRPDGSMHTPYPLVMGQQDGDSRPVFRQGGANAYFRSSRDGSPAIWVTEFTTQRPRRVVDAAVVPDVNPSPDGRLFAYQKEVSGWAGIFLYDVAAKAERLLIGGAAAGPLGYLRTATLTAHVDTVDTFESPAGGGPITRGNGAWVSSAVKRAVGQRWEVSDTWLDSTGKITAVQSSRTGRAVLTTELESVRATRDSASLLVTPERVTGWVVPQGQPARLFEGPNNGERFAGLIVRSAIAKSKPTIGQVFLAPTSSLYGNDPLAVGVDSIRVARRDTLYAGAVAIPAVVLARGSGETWIEEATGFELASHGNAGPGKWWWHIRRGVRPPNVRRP